MGEPEIGENVRYYREHFEREDGGIGLTQQELATLAGVNIGSIVAIEKSRPGTKLKTIRAVAHALHKHPADLFRRQSSEAVERGEAAAQIESPRVEVSPEALQAAILGAFRMLAAPPEDSERARWRKRVKQVATADRQAALPHGQAPTGTAPGPKRRGPSNR